MDSADKRAHLWENSKRLHAGLRQLGFTLGTDEPQSAIIAVIMPDLENGAAMWEALLNEGLYVNLARPPATPGRHDPAALLALRAAHRGAGRRDPRHVRCGRPCNRLHKLSESQGTFGFRQMVNGARLSAMTRDGEELRFDWRRGGAAAAGLVAALVLVVMVFLVKFANDAREQALSAERHAYDVALVVRNVSANMSRAEAALARFVLDEDAETSGNIYSSDWQLAGYQIHQLEKLMRGNPEQQRRVAELEQLYDKRGGELALAARAALAKQGQTRDQLFLPGRGQSGTGPSARRQARRDHRQRAPVAARARSSRASSSRPRPTASPII